MVLLNMYIQKYWKGIYTQISNLYIVCLYNLFATSYIHYLQYNIVNLYQITLAGQELEALLIIEVFLTWSSDSPGQMPSRHQ